MTEPLIEPVVVTAFASPEGNRTIVRPDEPLPVQITNSVYSAGADAIAGALIAMSVMHQRIHLGQVFNFSHVATGVADDGNQDFLVKVSADIHAHAIADAAASGDFELLLYEGVTASVDGTAVTGRNRNRSSAATPDTTVFHTPTITDTGTLIFSTFSPGGRKSSATGSSIHFDDELILKTSTDYLVRLTNRAGSAAQVSFSLTLYEVS